MPTVDLDSKYLHGTIRDGALRVVIDRPQRRNAFDGGTAASDLDRCPEYPDSRLRPCRRTERRDSAMPGLPGKPAEVLAGQEKKPFQV